MELNKQKVMAALHPRKFQENEDVFYQDLLKVYGNDPGQYNQKKQQPQVPGMEGMGGGDQGTKDLQANGQKMMSQIKEPGLREAVNG